mgnify:CR=1 FL=1
MLRDKCGGPAEKITKVINSIINLSHHIVSKINNKINFKAIRAVHRTKAREVMSNKLMIAEARNRHQVIKTCLMPSILNSREDRIPTKGWTSRNKRKMTSTKRWIYQWMLSYILSGIHPGLRYYLS